MLAAARIVSGPRARGVPPGGSRAVLLFRQGSFGGSRRAGPVLSLASTSCIATPVTPPHDLGLVRVGNALHFATCPPRPEGWESFFCRRSRWFCVRVEWGLRTRLVRNPAQRDNLGKLRDLRRR